MHLTDVEVRDIYFALGCLKTCCFVEDDSARELHTTLALDLIKSIFDDASVREQTEKIEKLKQEILFQSTVSDCIRTNTNPCD